MQTSGSVRLLPPLPPWLRFVLAGMVVAVGIYLMTAFERADAPRPDDPPPTITVAVPVLDAQRLAEAKDDTREHRLVIEPEPLRHLLAKAIDVSPTVAAALDRPETPVPLAELRAAKSTWRGRWLFYEGVLEDVSGPREGHPIQGYSIYEATVRLADGGFVLAAFSIAPAASIQRGSWVRIEGYLLKLRDTTYPLRIDAAPLLVGRELQRDYEDWGPVTQLDHELLNGIDDSSYWPGDPAWHDIEEDQGQPLWHLGAYARDTAAARSLAEWRRTPTVNDPKSYEGFIGGKIARGSPMRLFGTLILRTYIAAPANPANIKLWTVVWVQVREWGGQLLPVWVPKRVRELPERAQLEVRGYYYRWLNYEAQTGRRFRVPLLIADDLALESIDVTSGTKTIGMWLAIVLGGLILLLWWSQHRAGKASLAHSREMDERRRRRRARTQPTQG
ncbi:MAG: hypothetical protein JNN13_17335 [Planctomycetes bacterium]|nr:hypothetical protein [Planctomycetota bacterium]